ncbi:MAG: SAM-dependent methyltransferase [Gammaproteobacteria bacterium]|nr:SAM-dependent methyltransferase [Gammaproteobacteria bacterium]
MELSEVVPWGRTFSEYREMFSLTNDDLRKKILGCGDGPASFNVELNTNGGNVTSIDPIYQFSPDQIRSRIEEVYPQIMDQVSKNHTDYVWNDIESVEELGKVRMTAMSLFLRDYKKNNQKSGRYINASLPTLPFEEGEFELALCSHYLFLYSEHVNFSAHIQSMKELCRVAKEVRVYPLSISNNEESPHLHSVMAELERDGVNVSLVSVKYEFQKGATKMLVAKNT